jgi:adenylyl- and sulfurtransferase ThiI
MIKIVKNPNFPQFLEIFLNADLIEEVQGRAKAMRIAKKLAKENGLDYVILGDKMVDIAS